MYVHHDISHAMIRWSPKAKSLEFGMLKPEFKGLGPGVELARPTQTPPRGLQRPTSNSDAGFPTPGPNSKGSFLEFGRRGLESVPASDVGPDSRLRVDPPRGLMPRPFPELRWPPEVGLSSSEK